MVGWSTAFAVVTVWSIPIKLRGGGARIFAKLSQVPAAAKISWAEVSFIVRNCPSTHPGK